MCWHIQKHKEIPIFACTIHLLSTKHQRQTSKHILVEPTPFRWNGYNSEKDTVYCTGMSDVYIQQTWSSSEDGPFVWYFSCSALPDVSLSDIRISIQPNGSPLIQLMLLTMHHSSNTLYKIRIIIGDYPDLHPHYFVQHMKQTDLNVFYTRKPSPCFRPAALSPAGSRQEPRMLQTNVHGIQKL